MDYSVAQVDSKLDPENERLASCLAHVSVQAKVVDGNVTTNYAPRFLLYGCSTVKIGEHWFMPSPGPGEQFAVTEIKKVFPWAKVR
jgi:hypothetical protein